MGYAGQYVDVRFTATAQTTLSNCLLGLLGLLGLAIRVITVGYAGLYVDVRFTATAQTTLSQSFSQFFFFFLD